MELQQAIQEVGTLYRALTGSEIPPSKEPVQRIPERDAEEYVRRRFDELVAAARRLTDRAGPAPIAYPTWSPRLEALETADEYRIELELVGVKPRDVTVHLKGGCLVVQGVRAPREGVEVRWSEIARGGFFRTLQLPANIDAERGEATLRDGVLVVRLPKGQSPSDAERRIEVGGRDSS